MQNVTRRRFLKLSSLALTSTLVSCTSLQTDKPKKTNFLFILVDDLGWSDVGCFGSSFYETPNIDRLASEGMKFTSGYAACPVCSPTRASIMTGKYPARMDTTDWFGAPQPENVHKHWTKNKPLLPASYSEKMDLKEVTIAESLQRSGYSTFFAGKWHLGPTEEFWPKEQGFDINIGGCNRGHPGSWGLPNAAGYKAFFSPYNIMNLKDGPKGEHLPDRLATETAKFIEDNRDKPFLAYLSFYSVHTPLVSRDDLKKKYAEKAKRMNLKEKWEKEGKSKVRQTQNHAIYGGMVEAMDMAVGKVLTKLKALGLDDNTVVIFFSDNGGLSTAEGSPTSNLPLRGGKGWLYEGGIREATIVKWPGVTKPSSVCDEPIISTDFYPTMLEIAGMNQKPKQHIDGVSIVPLLKGEQMDRGAIYWHYPHYGNQGGMPGAAIREGKWKLIEWFESGKVELYNLKKDISETKDLASVRPRIVQRMHKKLKAWQKQTDAKFPTPNPKAKK